MANSVSILLLAGVCLAALYAVVYFTGSSGTGGAFVSAAGAGIFVFVIMVLAAVGLWQGKTYRKL